MSWDEYFYNIAMAVAKNSKCMSRQIGAVLVREKYILSTGFNGPPKNCLHCDVRYQNVLQGKKECPRRILGFSSGEGLHLCPAAHAERNAIDLAAYMGHSTKDCSLYLTCPIPCIECAKSIINAGIREVVVTSLTNYEKGELKGIQLFIEAGVLIRTYAMPDFA